MTPDDIDNWPAMRWLAIRRVGLAVLWRGPLLGLFFAALAITAAAGLCYAQEGQTLDFGCFQVHGQEGAAVFPVLSRLWRFVLLAVPFSTAFLGFCVAAWFVTVEVAYRRSRGRPRGRDS
jgi:hypothetical protein